MQQLFPGAFTETVNDQGELVTSVDFERLKAELGEFSDVFESRREKYGMDWPGKRDALRLVQEPSRATLKPCREESVDFDSTENLFIEGDNLEVLKLLQKSYYGKVKMIYIDPPYNTGNEFIYPDKYSESLDTYLSYAGLVDDEGRKFTTNTAAEGRFHTKWLNMMYPRLYLARNLLRDDGVIFMSIDDNEVENLRRMCNEIFGEENFVAEIIWQKRTSPDMRTALSEGHEYVLLVTKNVAAATATFNKLPLSKEQKSRYKNPDADPNGSWVSSDFTAQGFRPNQVYEITTPGGAKYSPDEGKCWKNIEEVYLKQVAEGRFWFGVEGNSVPRRKNYLDENEGRVPWTWWPNSEVGHTQEAKQETNRILGKSEIFPTPKPVRLLTRMLQISTEKDDLVMDFFAGSCPLAEAVLAGNSGGTLSINFIVVQLPEHTDINSVAHKAGYKTIADIGKERIRRAAKKIQQENPDYTGDLGFKVLKLNQSNFKQWQAPARNTSDDDLIQQMELHIDHVQEAADPEAILYELLIKAGFMPTEKVETLAYSGKTVYSIAEGALLICLEDEINHDLIQAVADAEPAQFICLDKAFGGNDQLKANAVQTFKALNQNREVKIEFRTV